jgi:holo-[acyl-carrier protein] synthase
MVEKCHFRKILLCSAHRHVAKSMITPLPFPFPLRVGTDICQISRIYRLLAGPRGPRFIRRVLTVDELEQKTPSEVLQLVSQLQDNKHISSNDGQAIRNLTASLCSKNDSPLLKAASFMAGR